MMQPFLHTVVRSAVHTMAHVDASSARLLELNEAIVDYAMEHDVAVLARLSMSTVQFFDALGSSFINLVVWLVSLL